MDQLFPNSWKGPFYGAESAAQDQNLEMEAQYVPDGQLATDSRHPMGLPGVTPSFHSITNVETESALSNADVEGPWQQGFFPFHSSPYRQEWIAGLPLASLDQGGFTGTDIPQTNTLLPAEKSGHNNNLQNIAKISKTSVTDWINIGPMFKALYQPQGYSLTLEQTASFLACLFGFEATVEEYRYRVKRGWPNEGGWPNESGSAADKILKKNKSNAAGFTTTKTTKREPNPHRKRSYRRSGKYNACPPFFERRVHVPYTLEPTIYKKHILLLRHTDEFVTGFLDSSLTINKGGTASEESIGNILVAVESNWRSLLNCCQGMFALLRNCKHFVLPKSTEECPLSKREKKKETNLYIRGVIDRIFEGRVLNRLKEMTKDSRTLVLSPFIFSDFWSICQILLALSSQLGSSKGAYVARFLRALRLSVDALSVDADLQSIKTVLFDFVRSLEPYFIDDIQQENGENKMQTRNEGHEELEAGTQAADVVQQEYQNQGSGTGNEDEETRRQAYLEKKESYRKIRKENRQQEIKERQVCLAEIKHIIRTTYQCATRAFSSRRSPNDPNVLRLWANYYRHVDSSGLKVEKFLDSYQLAFRKTEELYGPHHDYTVSVLSDYATTAYYTCHAKDLASTLANDLWNKTNDVCNTKPIWNAKSRGMAEAASILGLSTCIYHENMYKDSKARRKMRRSLGLYKNKKNRQIWRETLGPPPPPDQVSNTLICLDRTVKFLALGDWDCRMISQSMAINLKGLLLNFCRQEEQYQQAARGHAELGHQCLSRTISEADPSRAINMPLVVASTIHPAQLDSRSWPPM
ncbi:uncharacterized protein Z519_04993 [Cladophialophora bantiana CBS 173.52]|uniref:Clr5 domain-containing protein n=1 Tax=Cladophialophora bantiana (strain ATCC 10958 / CBS 173.52 / CDC B-1940 / NIH 8579) TaxID=1442370 RepID=A0A0D2HNR5_CLAB1|nr:uncharacterized protein Z519_04993 [Cladophialophora bantiana CBS 173.52]KIW95013.1 hypothetical protein Z519_04993 [Cladophialophora bantiana CBS 173.52]